MKVDNDEIIERIYDETLKLIFTYGAKGWTMDTVCKKSGIAKDTLYRIINKKETLIRDALLKELDRHDQRMEALLKQEKSFFSTLKDSVTLLSNLLEKFSLDHLSQIFLQYPSVESAINNGMEAYFQSFEDFLNEGKKNQLLKENVDVKLLIHFVHACVMQMLKQPDTFDATKDTVTLISYFIDGIKA